MKHLGHIHIANNEVWFVASKRSVEVSNVIEHLIPYLDRKATYKYYDVMFDRNNFEQIKHNQPCEAEVESEIVTITKISKP